MQVYVGYCSIRGLYAISINVFDAGLLGVIMLNCFVLINYSFSRDVYEFDFIVSFMILFSSYW